MEIIIIPTIPPMMPIFSNVAGKAKMAAPKKPVSMLKNVYRWLASPGPTISEYEAIDLPFSLSSSSFARLNFFTRLEAYDITSDFAPKYIGPSMYSSSSRPGIIIRRRFPFPSLSYTKLSSESIVSCRLTRCVNDFDYARVIGPLSGLVGSGSDSTVVNFCFRETGDESADNRSSSLNI